MRRRIRSGAGLILAATIGFAAALRAQAPAPDSLRIARLAALGRLWGTVKYFHPVFLYRAVNWDSAVVAAVPRVSAAGSTAEYAGAVGELLRALDDPTTRVVPPRREAPARSNALTISTRWEPDSALVVSIPSTDGFYTAVPQLAEAAPLLKAAPRIVFDLRGSLSALNLGSYTFDMSRAGILLPSQETAAPGERRRMYSGFPPQAEGDERFWSGSYDVSGRTLPAAPGNRAKRIAFVIDATSSVPDVAWALQRAGEAVIVMDDAFGVLPAATSRTQVALGEGLRAEVRTGAVADGDGRGLQADSIVTENTAGRVALEAALAMVRRTAPRRAARPAPASTARRVADDAYATMRFPALPYRLLAAYRWWATIQFFYPYKRLAGEHPDSVLLRSVPALERARDTTEYAFAVAEMVTHIHDSHGSVSRSALGSYFGTAQPRVLLQIVEGQPVVIHIGADSATRRSGIAVGDVIERIDGETAGA